MRADAVYAAGRLTQARLCIPLAAVLMSVTAALLLARDMGPLLVISLTCIVISGAYMGLRLTLISMAGMGAAIFAAVQWLPWFEIVRIRINIMRDPFGASNEHLAKLLWFQEKTPFWGFGPGQVPWCGYSTGCNGLPKQLHSDYTITALQGLYGAAGWMVPLLFVIWLFILIKNRVLKLNLTADPFDEKTLTRHLLAWLALLWGIAMFFQTAVTVAGNLGRLPITGINFPFISYGTTALLTTTFLFGLLMNRNVARGAVPRMRPKPSSETAFRSTCKRNPNEICLDDTPGYGTMGFTGLFESGVADIRAPLSQADVKNAFK